MRFFTRVAILFYVTTISTMGVLVIVFAATIDASLIEKINYCLNQFSRDQQIKILFGLLGFLFILLSFMFAKIISGAQSKERTIAFDNPGGRVTISLFALEDMIKRLVLRESEIKEVRSNLVATKKGLEVEVRLIFKADVNIPEMTSRLQELIKDKIQDMIGIEETIVVRIHVMKIISDDTKSAKRKGEPADKTETNVPFQGYRA